MHGDEGRIAAAGEAADIDVRAGLATGGLDPQSRDDLQQVGGALWLGLADLLQRGGGDREARVALAQTLEASGTADDHGVQCRGGVAV